MKRPRTNAKRIQPRQGRRAYVLVGVLIMIVVLSLLAYRFTDSMTSEYRGATRSADMVKLRGAAVSGIHYAAACLADNPNIWLTMLGGNQTLTTPSIFNNPGYFADQMVYQDPNDPNRNILFSVVCVMPAYTGTTSSLYYQQQYGVIDEGSKININALAGIDPTGNTLYNVLTSLITQFQQVQTSASAAYSPQELAANITAYVISASAAPLSNNAPAGATSSYYEAMPSPYYAKNGPLNTLDELLLVEGVTPTLLWGNDQNQNGYADDYQYMGPQGQSGQNTGQAIRGLSDFLTVNGRELNVSSTGGLRVYVNASSLSNLNTALSQTTVPQEMITYILGARLPGVTMMQQPTGGGGGGGKGSTGLDMTPERLLPSFASLTPHYRLLKRLPTSKLENFAFLNRDLADEYSYIGLQGGPPGGGNKSGGGPTTVTVTVTQGTTSQLQSYVSQQLPNATKAGANISSLPGLAGSSLMYPDPSGKKGSFIVVPCPMTNTTSSLTQYLPTLMDQLTTSGNGGSVQPDLTPRINISTAPSIVISSLLLSLPTQTSPTFTQEDVQNVISAQAQLEPGQPATTSGAWLLTTGQLTLAKYQQLQKYVTGTSSMYRIQAVGYYQGLETNGSGGSNAANWPMARMEALVDTNVGYPRIVYIRDLTALDNPRGFNLPLQNTQP